MLVISHDSHCVWCAGLHTCVCTCVPVMLAVRLFVVRTESGGSEGQPL